LSSNKVLSTSVIDSRHLRNVRAFLKQYRLSGFFIIAFVLSWYPWFIALARGRTTGPNPLGPFVAGIVMSAVVSGWTGLREFFGRLIRWRVGIQWYAIVLVMPVLICLSAVAILLCFVHALQVSALSTAKLRELPDRFIFTLLFVGLGEEPGWRGFALLALQKRHNSFIASLVLAPIWSLWHLPLIGNEFPWPIVAPFIISVFGGTFMLTWVFNGTNGSVLMTRLLHATINTVGAGLIFPLFSGPTLVVLWWIYSFIWLCAGLGALLFNAKRTRPTTAGA
jgi:membrane protease YdiL (CAAX protease family)